MDAKTRIGVSRWVIIATAALAAACSGSRSGARLGVSAKAVGPAVTNGPAGASALDLGQGISISRVRIAVASLKLEGGMPASGGGSGGDSGGGSGMDAVARHDGGSTGGGSDDAGEVRIGPFGLDLSGADLTGGLHHVLDSEVPPGTYSELRIDIGPVAAAGQDATLADLAGRSVVIDGTVDGAPFSFASSLSAEQKREMNMAVTADASSAGVVLTIDPSGWFRAADGSRLDPTSDANRAAIEANVAASVDAFEDDGHGQDGGTDPQPHA